MYVHKSLYQKLVVCDHYLTYKNVDKASSKNLIFMVFFSEQIYNVFEFKTVLLYIT